MTTKEGLKCISLIKNQILRLIVADNFFPLQQLRKVRTINLSLKRVYYGSLKENECENTHHLPHFIFFIFKYRFLLFVCFHDRNVCRLHFTLYQKIQV